MKKRYSIDKTISTHETKEVYLSKSKAIRLFNEYKKKDDFITTDLVQMTLTKDDTLKYKTLESYRNKKEVIL